MEALKVSQHLLILLTLISTQTLAREFRQTWRIMAGQVIDPKKLQMGENTKLNDVFIGLGDVDYKYCASYKKKEVYQQSIALLMSDIESCLARYEDCEPITWSAAALAAVQCEGDEADEGALAFTLTCNYTLYDIYVNYDTKSPMGSTLTLDINAWKEKCMINTEPLIKNLIPWNGNGRSAIKCQENKIRKAIRFIQTLVDSCQPPCQSVTVSKNTSYGCSYAQGHVKTNNLITTSEIANLTVSYVCKSVNGTTTDEVIQTTPQTTTQTVTISTNTATQWKSIGAAFIGLFLAILIGLAVAVYCIVKLRNQPQTSIRSKSNNDSLKVTQQVRPYTTHPPSTMTRIPASTVPEPDFYMDPALLNTSRVTSPKEEEEGDTYEAVTPRVNNARTEATTETESGCVLRPPSNNKNADKTSVVYVEFES